MIRRLVREPADAEDLLQEACLKAFRGIQRFQPGTDAKAWLLTILINTYRDWVRTMLRQPALLELDDLAVLTQPAARTSTASRTFSPEDHAVHGELS